MTKQVGDSKLIDTWSATGTIIDPDVTKKDEGWQLGEQPPHEWMNYLQNTFGQKINHIMQNGTPDWNNETEYSPGATVKRAAKTWLCVTLNTNSEPTDTNANWARADRAESIEGLGDGALLDIGTTADTVAEGTASTAAGTSYSGELTATDVQGAIDETMSNVTLGVNDVINGQFKIAQSGETFASAVNGAYDLDGWIRDGAGGAVTISRVAGAVAGSYARQSEVTTAAPTLAVNNYEMMQTRLLGYDCVKYIGETFTIRAKVKSDVTGIHCINIFNGTQSYVHEVNILAAGTVQTVVFTVVGGIPALNSSTNQYGFRLRFTQAAGTAWQTATTDAWVTGNFFSTAAQVNGLATVGNKFSIEDVSINLGTVALPNVTGFAAELARCRRYLKILGDAVTRIDGWALTATGGTLVIRIPVDTTDMNSLNPTVVASVGAPSVDIRGNGTTFSVNNAALSGSNVVYDNSVSVGTTVSGGGANLADFAIINSGGLRVELRARL